MNKERNRILEFAVKTFFIAVACNIGIALTVIHYNIDDSFALLPETFVFVAGVSLACFLPICLIMLLVAKVYAKVNPEKLFWPVMYVGVIATGLLFTGLRDLFSKYSAWDEVFSVIAIFSILVSTTSQYQLFIGADTNEDIPDIPVTKIPKPLATKDDFLNN